MASERATGGQPEVTFRPIGVIRSPFESRAGMPIQPTGAEGIVGTVELDPEFSDGLSDLDGFSHIVLLYHFHRSGTANLSVTPFLDTEPRGVFATRAPSRPNPIGLSVVTLLRVEATTLTIEGVDVLDGTPLLDIKPYVPEFDERPGARAGWLELARGRVQTKRSDARFA